MSKDNHFIYLYVMELHEKLQKNIFTKLRREIMSRSNISKKSKSRSEINKKYEKMRNWTTDEITLFAVVLSDDKFSFFECLEKRTLKK